MTKPHWHVQLGPTWSRFSAPRTDLQLLGTVQNGPQIDALGKLPDGCYVQVNGDVLSPVNTQKVQAAINAAMQRPARVPPRLVGPEPWSAPGAARATATAPVTALLVNITFKKRRTVPSDVQTA
jgi:hypothetical protein